MKPKAGNKVVVAVGERAVRPLWVSDLSACPVFGFQTERRARAFLRSIPGHVVVGKRVFASVSDVEAALRARAEAQPAPPVAPADDDEQLGELDSADSVLAALGLRRGTAA